MKKKGKCYQNIHFSLSIQKTFTNLGNITYIFLSFIVCIMVLFVYILMPCSHLYVLSFNHPDLIEYIQQFKFFVLYVPSQYIPYWSMQKERSKEKDKQKDNQ